MSTNGGTLVPSGHEDEPRESLPRVSGLVDLGSSDLSASPVLPIAKVLIVSDIRFLSEALAGILRGESGLSVAGVSSSLAEARTQCRATQPDIVLLDAALSNAPAAVATIKADAAQARVVALGVVETEEHVVAWGQVGVAAYIPRTASVADLVHALGNVMRGEQACSLRIAARLFQRLADRPVHQSAPQPALTLREAEIVKLLADGLCNKEIARKLDISLATTKSHVHNLLTKLSLTRRGQAAVWVRQYSAEIVRAG